MMGRQSGQIAFEVIHIEAMVPRNHLLRKIQRSLQFGFIYEKAKDLLQGYGENFSISNAFDVLRSVRQEGLWATRVSFIYSVAKNKVYYVLNNDFKNIAEYQF